MAAAEVAVGAGIIHGPVGAAQFPVAEELEAAVVRVDRRIHQAGEGPLGWFLVVPREGKLSYSTPGYSRKG